jgi:glycerol-3-phosphate acyltransferase PlsY
VEVLVVALGYLLGTIPTAELVGRRAGHDPTLEGSGNPGASNVFRTVGARAGALVFAGDVVKGMVATGIGLAAGDRMLALVCGAAAVVGHIAPVTRRFRGGKGVARGVLTLDRPDVANADDGTPLNSTLRDKRPRLASEPVLAGQLFQGFGRLDVDGSTALR